MGAMVRASVCLLILSVLTTQGYRIDYINTTPFPNYQQTLIDQLPLRIARHSSNQPMFVYNPTYQSVAESRSSPYQRTKHSVSSNNAPKTLRSESPNPSLTYSVKEPHELSPSEAKSIYLLGGSKQYSNYEEEPYQPTYDSKPNLESDQYNSAPTFHFDVPHQEFEVLGSEDYQKDLAELDHYTFKHDHKESHGEVHYHEHKHMHQHDHKQEHKHQHKQEHKHDHDHKHKHEGHHKHDHHQSHKHEHHSDHKHSHDHKHGHKHGHQHDHKHDHKHHQDHKHQHHHGHKHENEHKHAHHHGHKHEHHSDHKHDHKHHNEHKHEHGHKHNHGHKHAHQHQGHHGHEKHH